MFLEVIIPIDFACRSTYVHKVYNYARAQISLHFSVYRKLERARSGYEMKKTRNNPYF